MTVFGCLLALAAITLACLIALPVAALIFVLHEIVPTIRAHGDRP